MDASGKPFCPRRKWQQEQKSFMAANNGSVDPQMAPLATFGTEGTDSAGDQSLKNPVYLDDGKTTLVWIAPLRNNLGMKDANGNVIVPSILDPSFIPNNTDYIFCNLYPFIPAQHEAAYRQDGGLKEGDMVVATTVQRQQFSGTPVTDGVDTNVYQPLLLDGVVSKVNLVSGTPRASVSVDFNVEGT